MSGRRVSSLIFSSFCVQFSIVVDAATDRISQGQNITHSKSKVSAGEKKLIWVIALVVALAVLLLPVAYMICRWRSKLKEKAAMERRRDMLLFDINMSIDTSTNELSDGEKVKGENKDPWLPLFSFSSVSAATDNFSIENKLGEGGFGPVYKGKLLNGQEVAVKRLSRQSGQGLEELKNETMLIAKLQHRNLVRLLGCCLEHGEKILIYEFMPNKSLDSFIFDPIKKGLLDWGIRVRIIEGIAQGLLYLHEHSRLRIIHRDLKASNVLLDSNMNPKIADFGMARMFGGDELQANTNRIVGTYGYMPPEYALQGLFSIKSDVFSFGVLLLETLSSKKNTGFYNIDSLNLLGHAWELWITDKTMDLKDPILENEASYPMVISNVYSSALQAGKKENNKASPKSRPNQQDKRRDHSNQLSQKTKEQTQKQRKLQQDTSTPLVQTPIKLAPFLIRAHLRKVVCKRVGRS